MEIDYRFEHVSGTSADSMYTIGVRFDAQYVHHDAQECWCIHIENAVKAHISCGNASWYTGVWAAPSGEAFISDASGVVFRRSSPDQPWATDSIGPSLQGVWGLRPDLVLAWAGPDEKLFRWDGATWSPMAHPGGWIRAIQGTAADLLYAVGHDGLARWDGTAWTRVPCPPTRLTALAVASPQQIFAAGPGGELLEGSEHGMSKLLQHDGEIFSLAWWRDALWVGSDMGLCKLVDGRLEVIKDNIVKAYALDGRGDLLICEPHRIVATRDGAKFPGSSVKGFARFCAGNAALWAPTTPIDYDHGDDP